MPGRAPIPFFPLHYHVLLNKFSTVYLKINKTKDWGWRSSTWGTQGRGNPYCCCCGKGGHPCWVRWANRAGCGEWSVPYVHLLASSEPSLITVNVPAVFQPSSPFLIMAGFFSVQLCHSMPLQQHLLLLVLKCHSFKTGILAGSSPEWS